MRPGVKSVVMLKGKFELKNADPLGEHDDMNVVNAEGGEFNEMIDNKEYKFDIFNQNMLSAMFDEVS